MSSKAVSTSKPKYEGKNLNAQLQKPTSRSTGARESLRPSPFRRRFARPRRGHSHHGADSPAASRARPPQDVEADCWC